MRLLDLFCGAGGAAMGYHRAGFDEIVGVDINPQPSYPFEFHQADATTYPLDGFDAIHASPPCQGYCPLNAINKRDYPMLIDATRERLAGSGLPWVIENVVGAPMLYYVQLCGTHFGLNTFRHRLFETSHLILSPGKCSHRGIRATTSGGDVMAVYRKQRGTLAQWRDALGVDWMDKDELAEAIPPAYTEWIGQQLLAAIGRLLA
jgi:DNA (cytosine-5)-methyltransferase 1